MNLNDDVVYAAGGSGRSTSFIPALRAAWSVTTIAFIVHLPVWALLSTCDQPNYYDFDELRPASQKPLVSPHKHSARFCGI